MDGVDGLDPVFVYCDMHTIPATDVINSVHQQSHSYTNASGSVSFMVNYSAKLEHILSLISDSDQCSQSVSYVCRQSPLTKQVRWYDRDGKPATYWSSGVNYANCVCGMHQACFNACKYSYVKYNTHFKINFTLGPSMVDY